MSHIDAGQGVILSCLRWDTVTYGGIRWFTVVYHLALMAFITFLHHSQHNRR